MYKGYYINLKKDRKRDKGMKRRLKKLRLNNYSRFEAVLGSEVYHKYNTSISSGELGCSLSHLSLLGSNLSSATHIHILEDDALLHKLLPTVLQNINTQVDWDIIYSDVYFSLLDSITFYKIYEECTSFKSGGEVSFVNLRGILYSGATSYFVNKKSIRKLYNLLNTQKSLHVKSDTYINSLVQEGKLNAYVMIPFLSTLSDESVKSTIDESYNDNMFAMDRVRKSFYIDAKHDELLHQMREKVKTLKIAPSVSVYANLNKIILNDLDK